MFRFAIIVSYAMNEFVLKSHLFADFDHCRDLLRLVIYQIVLSK